MLRNFSKIFLSLLTIFHIFYLGLCDTLQYSINTILPNNSYIELRDYILNTQTIPEQFGNLNGTLSFSLTNPDNSSTFNVYMLQNSADITCYKMAMQNLNLGLCNFSIEPSANIVQGVKSFTVNFTDGNFTFAQSAYGYVILDNTIIGGSGASMTDINLSIVMNIMMENTDIYFENTIKSGIALSVLVVVCVALTICIGYRYRRLQFEYKMYHLMSESKVTSQRESERDLRKKHEIQDFGSEVVISKKFM